MAKKPLPHYRVYFHDEDGHRAFAQTSQPPTIERRSRKRGNFWIVKTWSCGTARVLSADLITIVRGLNEQY
jgi:hypothetical protein